MIEETPEAAPELAIAPDLRRLVAATEEMTDELRLRPTKGQIDEAIKQANRVTRIVVVVVAVAVILVVGVVAFFGSRGLRQISSTNERLQNTTNACATARGQRNLAIIIGTLEDDLADIVGRPHLVHKPLPTLPEGCT